MRICCISDTHGFLPDLPPCDLLLHGGDLCPINSHEILFQQHWLETNWIDWLNNQPCDRAVCTWGNHDWIGELPHLAPKGLPVYNDELVEYNGIRIWCSAWQKRFANWAFNLDEDQLAEKYNKIPEGTDIIVSHGPALGYGDWAEPNVWHPEAGEHTGSPSLLKKAEEVGCKLLVSGHIHSAYSINKQGNCWFVNASLLNERYQLVNTPILFNYENGEFTPE